MGTRNKIVYLLVCGILLAGLITSCAPAEKAPIKIAFLSDLTSPGTAAIAALELEGCKMAVEDINADGGLLGRNLELLVADTKTDPTVTISQARRLGAEGIIAVVGSTSSTEVIALAKWAADEGHIPIIPAYAATNELLGHPWIFRPFDMYRGEGSALFLAKKLGKTKVGLLHTNLAYGIDAARVIQEIAPEHGVQMVEIQGLDFQAPDATVQVTKLRDAGAEIVTLAGFADVVAGFARALAAIDWHPTFTAHIGNVVSGMLIVGPDLMEGCIARTCVDYERPEVKEIFDRYEQRTGNRRDDDPMTNAYSDVQVLAQAIEFAKTADDPVAIRDAMYKVEFKNLLLGKEGQVFTFTPEKNSLLALEDYSYMVLEGGKFTPLKLE